jgi:acyl carrier protein
MLERLICLFGRRLLALRYRVSFAGIETVAQKRDGSGILFLPSHPALIDPFLVASRLFPRFRMHMLADESQVDRPVLRWLARRFGVVRLADAARDGAAAREGIQRSLDECARLLAAGENVLLYPAGHIMRSRREEIGSNSGVETLLRAAPDARVVLVRTRGLWGSVFSRADGGYPDLGLILRKAVKTLLLNGIFFAPRRPVDIVLWEPDAFPAQAGRREINAFIENFFNDNPPPNTYVPYTRFESRGIRAVAEPPERRGRQACATASAAVQAMALAKIAELSGHAEVKPEQRLANDLGMDSLSRVELAVWIEQEFGFQVPGADMLETAGDVVAAAAGEALAGRADALPAVPERWFRRAAGRGDADLCLPTGATTLTEAFLRQAARQPGASIVADPGAGVKTYRDLVTAIYALKEPLAELPGARVGVMLPATPVAGIVWLALLFAGKVPVMINWTTGERQMRHMSQLLEIERIVTARKLTMKLKAQGTRFGEVEASFVFLEDVGAAMPLKAKLRAKALSYFSWNELRKASVPDTVAILFTSGSENMPKAVPLTHANILANIRDVLAIRALRPSDILIGFLPPFHSFGLTLTFALPLISGLRTVYHPNPTEGAVLARIIERYKVTVMAGTPTFLSGILRGAAPQDLASLRLGVTGAEKCPEPVYEGLRATNPRMTVLEGYGITECSPVVSVNRPEAPVPFSIGKVMDSLEYAIVDETTGEVCPPGRRGMLLVRGPSVFGGYLRYEGASPFVEHAGRSFYRTGDLVEEDASGTLFFRGRLKRFVKLGGEMISLPAIEETLLRRFGGGGEEGPVLAVDAPGEDAPEITLFSVRGISREEANQALREEGFSPLHNIRVARQVSAIPVLGSGKTDYRTLVQSVAGPS